MKLIIKNLKQVTYDVEVPSEKSTILELKKEIEKAHNFEAEHLKLLYKGVVLEDTKTLEDYKIEDGFTIIMMTTKAIAKNVQPEPQSTENKPPEEKKEEKQEKKEEKKPEPKPQPSPEEKYANQINTLVEMGYEKSQVIAAIKAARGHVEVAVEFLTNGIPEGINDNDNDQLMEGEGEGEGEGEEGDEDIDPLKKTAIIAKVICQNDPVKLQNFLANINQNDPDLMALITEHQDEFREYLEQPLTQNDYRIFKNFQQELGLGGEEQPHHHGPGGHGIQLDLSPQDREAIKRLKELGNFNEAEVIQAYIACEKNEEMAANYLFEQKMRDDDEMFGNNNNNGNNNQGNNQ